MSVVFRGKDKTNVPWNKRIVIFLMAFVTTMRFAKLNVMFALKCEDNSSRIWQAKCILCEIEMQQIINPSA